MLSNRAAIVAVVLAAGLWPGRTFSRYVAMGAQRAYKTYLPWKMALHKCLKDVPISFRGAMLIQKTVAFGDPLCELIEAYRSGRVEQLLPSLPGRDTWMSYHRNHRLLGRDLAAAMPELWRARDLPSQHQLDEVRAVSRYACREPESCRYTLRGAMTNREWAEWFAVEVRLVVRHYGRHLVALGRELRAVNRQGEDERSDEQLTYPPDLPPRFIPKPRLVQG